MSGCMRASCGGSDVLDARLARLLLEAATLERVVAVDHAGELEIGHVSIGLLLLLLLLCDFVRR